MINQPVTLCFQAPQLYFPRLLLGWNSRWCNMKTNQVYGTGLPHGVYSWLAAEDLVCCWTWDMTLVAGKQNTCNSYMIDESLMSVNAEFPYRHWNHLFHVFPFTHSPKLLILPQNVSIIHPAFFCLTCTSFSQASVILLLTDFNQFQGSFYLAAFSLHLAHIHTQHSCYHEKENSPMAPYYHPTNR